MLSLFPQPLWERSTSMCSQRFSKNKSLLRSKRFSSISSGSSFSENSLEDDNSEDSANTLAQKRVWFNCLLEKFKFNSMESNEAGDPTKSCRILFLGASSVGKTSVVSKFMGGKGVAGHRETVQEMYRRELVVGKAGVRVSVTLEDTGGFYTSEFPVMAALSLRHCDLLVLVYSLADPSSWQELCRLRDQALAAIPNLPILVLANQADRDRAMPFEEVEATVSIDWECGYMETSARTTSQANMESLLCKIVCHALNWAAL